MPTIRSCWSWVAAIGLAMLLAGCTHVTLVPPYDERIDAGLTDLYAETTAFADRMVAARGTPEGTYARNSDFYDRAEGRVAALVVRAEAHQAMGDCPATSVMERALAAIPIPADARGEVAALPRGDCQVALLRLIGRNYARMRDVHRDMGPAGLSPMLRGAFIDGGVGSLLRSAITVEIAKRGAADKER